MDAKLADFKTVILTFTRIIGDRWREELKDYAKCSWEWLCSEKLKNLEKSLSLGESWKMSSSLSVKMSNRKMTEIFTQIYLHENESASDFRTQKKISCYYCIINLAYDNHGIKLITSLVPLCKSYSFATTKEHFGNPHYTLHEGQFSHPFIALKNSNALLLQIE